MKQTNPANIVCTAALILLGLVAAIDFAHADPPPPGPERDQSERDLRDSYEAERSDAQQADDELARQGALIQRRTADLLVSLREYRRMVEALQPAPVDRDVCTWFEANSQQYLDQYLAHAADWPGQPIMTAWEHNAVSHAQQCIDAGLPVIAGFKTARILRGRPIEDAAAWAEVAALARELSAMTDGRPVVLEHETMIQEWREAGGSDIDYPTLLAAIEAQEWPEIWWYYSAVGSGEPLRSISLDLSRAAMAGIPQCRLIEPATAGYKTEPRWLGANWSERMTYAIDPDALALVYLSDTAANLWPLDEVEDAIERAPGDVIIYPGFSNIEREAVYTHHLGMMAAYPGAFVRAEVIVNNDIGPADQIATPETIATAIAQDDNGRLIPKLNRAAANGSPVLLDIEPLPYHPSVVADYIAAVRAVVAYIREHYPQLDIWLYSHAGRNDATGYTDRMAQVQQALADAELDIDAIVPQCYQSRVGVDVEGWLPGVLDRASATGHRVIPIVWPWSLSPDGSVVVADPEQLRAICKFIADAGIRRVQVWVHWDADLNEPGVAENIAIIQEVLGR